MPEPTRDPVRPIPMKRLVAVAALLVLAGCGSAESGSGGDAAEPSSPSPSVSERLCGYGSVEGRLLTEADVDGDGTAEEIRLTRASGDCGAAVIASRESPEVAMWVSEVPAEDPPVTSAFAIAPTWSDGQLLVTRADHPRGGYQLRIYTVEGESLTELTVDGQPLVPFVATDVSQGQARVDCSDDGFVVVAGQQQTTYAVDGTDVSAESPTRTAGEPVAQPAFASCRP